jgi:hypothetical protein
MASPPTSSASGHGRIGLGGRGASSACRAVATAVVGVAVALSVPRAVARGAEQDRAVAQALFEQGRSLMNEKRWGEACPKLAESHRLDPAGGTLLNLGLCYEGWGKTATAWAVLKDALARARADGRADRESFIRGRLQALQDRLSFVTVVVSRRADDPGLRIWLDGLELGRAGWNAPIPSDPGPHGLEASLGSKRWRTRIVLGDPADRQQIVVPDLGAGPAPSSTVPASAPVPTQARAAPGSSASASLGAEAPHDSASQAGRTAGYVVGGIGLAAIGVGSYFGLRAMSKWNERKEHCPAGACDAAAVELGRETDTAAIVADAGFGVGLAALGVATWLLLASGTSESTPSTSAHHAPASGRASVRLRAGAAGGVVSVGGAW